MTNKHKTRLVNGIILMSQPSTLFATIASMLLLGWIAMKDIPAILWICTLTYLILSIVGGALAKSIQKESKESDAHENQ